MATPYERVRQWMALLEQIVPAPRRRKRKHVVPFAEWVSSFAFAQNVVARAYNKAIEYVPPTEIADLHFLGIVIRTAINKYLLPKIRAYEATHKGIESPEEIGKLIIETIDELLKDEKALRDAIERAAIAFGISKDKIDKYVEVAKKILPKMREIVEMSVKQLLERLKTARA